MILKRFFTLALAASFALVGCIANPDEYDPDYVISFSPAVGAIDSDSSASAAYPTGSTFGVWAFMLPEGQTWASNGPQAKTWLDNATVSYSGDGWKTSDSKHWGASGEQLSFFAYSPSSLPVSYDNTWGLTLAEYNTLTDKADFLYTDVQADLEKNVVTGRVAIPFKPALSKVVFRVMSSKASYKIVLKSLKLGDVYYKGKFHSQPAGWDLTTDKTDLEFCTKDLVLSTREAELETFTVIAQALNRPVTVVIDAFDEDGEQIAADKAINAKTISGKWTVGRKYVYTLDITSDEVTYKTDVLD